MHHCNFPKHCRKHWCRQQKSNIGWICGSIFGISYQTADISLLRSGVLIWKKNPFYWTESFWLAVKQRYHSSSSILYRIITVLRYSIRPNPFYSAFAFSHSRHEIRVNGLVFLFRMQRRQLKKGLRVFFNAFSIVIASLLYGKKQWG